MRALRRSFLLLALLGLGSVRLMAQEATADHGSESAAYVHLLDRLAGLAARWEAVPTPRVPPSGRTPEEVLEDAGPLLEPALQRLGRLLALQPAARRAEIHRAVEAGGLTELDLWLPLVAAEGERWRSRGDAAANYVEIALEWAQEMGRQDALWLSAGFGLEFARSHRPLGEILALGRIWARLPSQPGTERGQALVLQVLAGTLVATGDLAAVDATLARARGLYEALGERLGLANLLLAEADLALHLGKSEASLGLYRRARLAFEELRDVRGQAIACHGEGRALTGVDRPEGALPALHRARALAESVGDPGKQGNTWQEEAVLHLRAGAPELALPAFHRAGALFVRSGDLVGQANARRGEGDALFVLGAVEPAIEAQREALTLALAMGDPLGEGNARLGLGDALFAAGDVPGALAAFELGRAAFEAAGEPVGRANALLGTGQVRAVAGQHDESLALARQARQLFEAALDQFGEGNAWHQEGEVLLRLGELEGAVAAFRRAALAAEEGGNPLGLGNAWLGQGDAQVRRADSAAALAAYGEARRIFAAIGHDLGLGSTWRGEGDALLLSGRNEEALAAYRRARDLLAAAGSWAELGNAWQGEGNLFVRLRENETALAAYRAAGRAFVIAGQPAGQSRAWRGEGTVLYQNGQHSPALAALRRARALAEEGGDRIEQGNSWWCEGLVLAATGRPSEALAAYRRARELFAAAGDGNGEGNTLLGEARALTTLGDLPGALAGAAAATALFEEHGILSASIRALLVQVRVLSRMGQFEEAAALAEEAVRRHERWRRTYVTDAQRTLEDDDEIASAYDLLVPLRARQAGREEEALGLAEEARSRTLLDALSTRRGGAPPALAGDPEVEADLARLEVIAARTADPVTRREIERRRRDLHRAQRWQEYERLVAAGNPLLVGRPLTGGEIRALAREPGGGPILLYYATASEVVAFLVPVDGGSPLVRLLHLPLDQLAERVGALRRALANPALEAQAPALARELWDLLIAPFAADLPAGAPLTVVPHGPLHRLPFETLLDPEGKPLFERWPLATAPSATVLRLLRAGRPDRVRDLFLAMAPAGGDAPRPEVGRIAALFGPAAGGGFPAAGFETYRDEAPKVRHLLIAARGTLEPGSRAETFLEIPASSDHDSQLDAAEIAGIPLAAELVTLAACDTAAAEALFSDERLDLARAFLIAGAAAVLATRWKIPDEAATYRFLEDFYRAYRRSGPDGRGQRKDAALAEARQRSRRRGDPASVWAAWVLVGEAR